MSYPSTFNSWSLLFLVIPMVWLSILFFFFFLLIFCHLVPSLYSHYTSVCFHRFDAVR
ncbi:hypothetical protein AB4K20DRAFT_1981727 [Rhizopus microsporus]